MQQEDVDAWIRILRDFIIVVIGTFMLVFETVFRASPNVDVLSVGAALLGFPLVLRLDVWSRGNGNGGRRNPERESDDDRRERWSHLE